MKRQSILYLFLMLAVLSTDAAVDSKIFEGRWDITIDYNGKKYPSWLEIRHSGIKTFVGHFVGVWGSARPVSHIKIEDNMFQFSIPPQWEPGDGDMRVEGKLVEQGLTGTIEFPDGKKYNWTGVRAPDLRTTRVVTFEKPVSLIDKNSLKGWKALGENQWVVQQGVLSSPKSGANLMTEEKFDDFKLHVEFRYPQGSNSGVYLRGRYEVQIADSHGKEPLSIDLGGVYGFVSPNEQVAKVPGEWQTYDITLIGRLVTIVANGKTIVSNQEIPGITGGALDSNESEPGPILLQGDHGPVEFRNMTIARARK